MKRIAGLTLIATFCAGCASAPERRPPETDVHAPVEWTGPATATVDTTELEWWGQFDDTKLDTLVAEALLNNYDIMAAVARVDAAAATARVAAADLWPQLNADAQAARQRNNIIGLPIPGGGDVITIRNNSFGVSLDMLWEVDLWGRIRKGQSAALADVQASQAELAGVRLSIAGQTAKSWFAILEAKQQVDLARETVASFQRSVDQVQRRYMEGVRTSLDLRLALAALSSGKALHALREQQLDRATRQMEILLGRYPAGEITADQDFPTITASVPAGLPSELLIRRPDLIAAERRFAAAEARVSQARRAFFPRITLTGSAGTLSNELEDLTDLDFSVWSIAAGLVQPIFQGGRLRANLAGSHAASDLALVAYVQSLLGAFGEVEMALFAEQSLAAQEIALAEATRQAEAARGLAAREYNAGLTDYVTVLETQRQSLNRRSELFTVRRQRLEARINLHLALGGGFDMSQNWSQFLAAAPIENGGAK